jgi:hypothetical protein
MPRSKIVNTFDQLMASREIGMPDVAICPRHIQGTMQFWRDGWKVWRPKYNLGTETNPFDWDYGCKIFAEDFHATSHKLARKDAFAAAVAWAKSRYKISQFVRNRMGDYVDSLVNELFPLPKRSRS